MRAVADKQDTYFFMARICRFIFWVLWGLILVTAREKGRSNGYSDNGESFEGRVDVHEARKLWYRVAIGYRLFVI